MSFPRYPKYKASGVEWLGEVPEHWEVCALRRITLSMCDGPFGSGLKSEHYSDHGVRVVRLQNIKPMRFDGTDAAYIDHTYCKRELGDHYVIAEDVLVAGLGDENNTVGRACVAPASIGLALVKADCFRFRLVSELAIADFVAAALTTSSPFAAGTLATGSTRSRISLSETATRLIPLPPLAEQRAIAAFLDRETKKIDELVAEQERLIELLKEKRQAVISHAVTKGLDPAAPMKPSGVEWLGDVPAHWNVVPLRHLMRLTSGGTPNRENRDYWDGAIPWASSKDLKSEELFDTQEHVTERALRDGRVELVPVGSILTVVRGMILLHTFPVVVARVPTAINQDLKAILPTEGISSDFMAWLLRGASDEVLRRTDEAGHGTKVLRMEAWLAMCVAVPPLDEQAGICRRIADQLSALDELLKQAESAISLLTERRSALISAAVTGQIDVRNAVPGANPTEAA